ncbi:MAG: hypothetical protein A4E62_01557 [Syntrophorhabdus sp. PtaU1.Bin002]|nr:MAG: hypothetical protein A4E62_01557 [Syntrophorhabdus sp. PtaU1.Bin002]
MTLKPLFIPLKREHFEAFENGTKTTEFRQYGPRWNERTCVVGRPVVLSLGYGKQRRLEGLITAFSKKPLLKSRCGVLFWTLFGYNAHGPVAEIDIDLQQTIEQRGTGKNES